MYEKIKELCREKKISVTKLEEKLGFSTGSICKWDNSKPSFEKVVAVAKEFDVTIDYFI